MIPLLDVNLLIALAWPHHSHHHLADAWFSENRSRRWATCPLTQLAFLRLSTQPAVVKTVVEMSDALMILASNLAAPDHEFWPLDYSLMEVISEIARHTVGHNQLTDALLLDLAIRKGGRLATFDRRVCSLLDPQSPHLANIEILSSE